MNPTAPARFDHRLGLNQPASSPTARRVAEMAAAIAAETDGACRIEVFPESRLGPDPQMFADLQKGALDFFLSGATLGGIAPTSGLPMLPFAFRDAGAVFVALDGGLGDIIRGELAGHGLHAFRECWQNGFHHLTTRSRPIRDAGDFAGLRIRTPGGAIAADFFRTLGAEAGMVPFSGLYQALKAGRFDGQSDPLGVVLSLRLYEVQDHLSLTGHWWSGFTLLANGGVWAALPAKLQAVVTRNVAKFALAQRADIAAVNAAGVDELTRLGMTVDTVDATALRASLGDFYARWRQNFGAAAWRQLERYAGAIQ